LPIYGTGRKETKIIATRHKRVETNDDFLQTQNRKQPAAPPEGKASEQQHRRKRRGLVGCKSERLECSKNYERGLRTKKKGKTGTSLQNF